MPFIHGLCQTTKRDGSFLNFEIKDSYSSNNVKYEVIHDKKSKIHCVMEAISQLASKEVSRLYGLHMKNDSPHKHSMYERTLSYIFGEKAKRIYLKG